MDPAKAKFSLEARKRMLGAKTPLSDADKERRRIMLGMPAAAPTEAPVTKEEPDNDAETER